MRSESIYRLVASEGERHITQYQVGVDGVTALKWSRIAGDGAWLDTVQVFIGDALASEHVYKNCQSVFFGEAPPADDAPF